MYYHILVGLGISADFKIVKSWFPWDLQAADTRLQSPACCTKKLVKKSAKEIKPQYFEYSFYNNPTCLDESKLQSVTDTLHWWLCYSPLYNNPTCLDESKLQSVMDTLHWWLCYSPHTGCSYRTRPLLLTCRSTGPGN